MTAAFRGKNKYGMGEYTRTTEEDEAGYWCLHNDICITPRQAKWGERSWYIDIEKGKYPNRRLLGTSPKAYGPGTIWEKVSEYQLYYYNKYGK
jgi:hypothetical protein|tara:strand:+ start:2048 stop:2326 length:279 start_codon:yes stop_codon:yes gene_type:complete